MSGFIDQIDYIEPRSINVYLVNNILLLRDVFHIGLVIGPRPAVLAWGAAERQIQQTEANMKNIT